MFLHSKIFYINSLGTPTKPQNLRVHAMFLGRLILRWNPVRKDILHYDLNITNTATKETVPIRFLDFASIIHQKTEYEVTNLARGTEYSFLLRATSKKQQIGEWSDPLIVTMPITIAPYVTKDLDSIIYIAERSDSSLECLAEGNPLPSYQWYRNGIKISQSDPKYQMEGNKLTMKDVLRGPENNDAHYKCEAINNIGSVNSSETYVRVECK